MRILVLGAYGLIGTHVVRHLLEDGHQVIGLGRDVRHAARRSPDVQWISADMASLQSAGAWQPVLLQANALAIVNCAGALQDGARDRVDDLQSIAMRALFDVAPSAGIKQIVQISAPRADLAATTAFMRSKGEADAALQASALDWIIFRPGLVISPQAYGGTALLRALAAFPLVQPLAYGDSLLQTVSADEVADAVLHAVSGRLATRRTYDLVEDRPHTLREVVSRLRAWLGHPPAIELRIAPVLIMAVGRICDGLGWLGWRPPLRTTAIVELAAGVVGDPALFRAQTGRSLASLETTLRRLPSTVQDRWFARAFLLKPIAIAVLAAFWIMTGLTTLRDLDAASAILADRGVAQGLAHAFVVGGVLVDLALGVTIVFRAYTAWSAMGMIAVTLAYLAGGTVLVPDLWLDPLGPLLKAIPAMTLALVALAYDGDR